jgi:hypothetical protein
MTLAIARAAASFISSLIALARTSRPTPPSSARTAARTASPRLAVAAGDRDIPHCDTVLLAHEVDRAKHRTDRADHAGK